MGISYGQNSNIIVLILLYINNILCVRVKLTNPTHISVNNLKKIYIKRPFEDSFGV